MWKRKPLSDHQPEKINSILQEKAFGPIITHSLYLVNLASDKPDLIKKSIDVLQYDLAFDAALNGGGVVVHTGSHQGRGWETVRDQVAEKIVEIIQQSPANSTFLIENSAGQKGKLCSDLVDVRWLIDAVRTKLSDQQKSQIGWCFDTCHAHAAGYRLGQDQTPSENDRGLAVDAITDLKLWDDLKCVHVNDSRDEFNSGRDRHENLGKGAIPEADMKVFLNNPEIASRNIPLILEVPGLDGKGPDKPNLDVLKNWIGA